MMVFLGRREEDKTVSKANGKGSVWREQKGQHAHAPAIPVRPVQNSRAIWLLDVSFFVQRFKFEVEYEVLNKIYL